MITTQPMEVKKDGLRQMQDGCWKLTVTVHPNDMPTGLMTAPMGTRYGMALVEIGDDEKPVQRAPEAKEKRKSAESRAELARRLCGVPEFQDFVLWTFPALKPGEENKSPYELTSNRIKDECRVESKNSLDVNYEAGQRWDAFLLKYKQKAGRFAEMRR